MKIRFDFMHMFNKKFLFDKKPKVECSESKHIPSKSEEDLLNNLENLISDNKSKNCSLSIEQVDADSEPTGFLASSLALQKMSNRPFTVKSNNIKNSTKITAKGQAPEFLKHKQEQSKNSKTDYRSEKNEENKNDLSTYKIKNFDSQDIKSSEKSRQTVQKCEKTSQTVKNDKNDYTSESTKKNNDKPEFTISNLFPDLCTKTERTKYLRKSEDFSDKTNDFQEKMREISPKFSPHGKKIREDHQSDDLSQVVNILPSLYYKMVNQNDKKSTEIKFLNQKIDDLKNLHLSIDQSKHLSDNLLSEIRNVKNEITMPLKEQSTYLEVLKTENCYLNENFQKIHQQIEKIQSSVENLPTHPDDSLTRSLIEIKQKLDGLQNHEKMSKIIRECEKIKIENTFLRTKITFLRQQTLQIRKNFQNIQEQVCQKLKMLKETPKDIENMENDFNFFMRCLVERINKKSDKKSKIKQKSATVSDQSDSWSIFKTDRDI